jgi:hypothetical protein
MVEGKPCIEVDTSAWLEKAAAASHHTTPHHTTPYHTTPHHTSPHHTTPHHTRAHIHTHNVACGGVNTHLRAAGVESSRLRTTAMNTSVVPTKKAGLGSKGSLDTLASVAAGSQ